MVAARHRTRYGLPLLLAVHGQKGEWSDDNFSSLFNRFQNVAKKLTEAANICDSIAESRQYIVGTLHAITAMVHTIERAVDEQTAKMCLIQGKCSISLTFPPLY